jgi:hypothetical protein
MWSSGGGGMPGCVEHQASLFMVAPSTRRSPTVSLSPFAPAGAVPARGDDRRDVHVPNALAVSRRTSTVLG